MVPRPGGRTGVAIFVEANRQSGEPTHLHADREALRFGMRRANLVLVGIAENNLGSRVYYVRRGVAPRFIDGLRVRFDEHSVINPPPS